MPITMRTAGSAAPVVPNAPSPLCNDEGAAVRLGNQDFGVKNANDGSCKFYCGRRLGVNAIPGSDGSCGPSGGPQCQSCQRFQAQLRNDEAPVAPAAGSTSQAPPPASEEDARVAVLAWDPVQRGAASKSVPNEFESRQWSDLTWSERLSLLQASCNGGPNAAAVEMEVRLTQEKLSRMRAVVDVSDGTTAATANSSCADASSSAETSSTELVWSDVARIDLGGGASCAAHSKAMYRVDVLGYSLEDARAQVQRDYPAAFKSRPRAALRAEQEQAPWQAEMEEKRRKRQAEVEEEGRRQEAAAADARARAHAIMNSYYSGGKITPDGAAFVAQQVLKGIGFSYGWGSTIANMSGNVTFSHTATGKIQEVSNSEQFGHGKPTEVEEMTADQFAEMLLRRWESPRAKPLADAVKKKFLSETP